jgi:hypothetical protein
VTRRGTPGRESAAARSTERQIWYGYGQLTRAEKSRFGVFLHDTTRLFAEVSVFSLPVLLFVMEYPATGWFDAKATGIVAWLTAVIVGTLVRGGFVGRSRRRLPAGSRSRPPCCSRGSPTSTSA